MKILIYSLMFFVVACTLNTSEKGMKESLNNSLTVKDTVKPESIGANKSFSSDTLWRFKFVDSTQYRPDKDIFLEISSDIMNMLKVRVYKNKNGKLDLIQQIDSLGSFLNYGTPEFEDFNQDGIMDLKLNYGTGARGANQLYYLFIQNKDTGKLTYIKGSSDIPNISFDKERKVITATYFYGGTSFVDFNLKQDSLIRTNKVDVSVRDVWTIREYYKYDEQGKKILVNRDSTHDEGRGLFIRDDKARNE